MESSARREDALLTPRAIYDRLATYVMGQEAAKRAVALAAYQHIRRTEARKLRRQSLLRKSNILLIGPTGSGKTHIARTLATTLSVPFTTADATEYTEAGYYGKDVEMMIADLLTKAHHSVEDAERGIIFIDEVDKIARRSQGMRNGAGSRDIGGEGVQQALLKMLEGREVHVPLQVTQGWNKHDTVTMDTRDILFICAGTFSDLFQDQDEARRSIGFGAEDEAHQRRRLSVKQLTDFGMLAEFLGRVPVTVQLEPLGPEELKEILTGPPDALVREYRERLALEEISLEYTSGALDAIVRFSLDQGLGARGLRGIMEHVMSDLLFDAPERRQRKLEVDAQMVKRRLKELEPSSLSLH